MPHAQSPYSLDDITEELNIPLLFVPALERPLAQPSLLSQLLHDDNHLLQMLSSSHSMTWFQVPGCGEIQLSATGCGPGGPLADMIYNVAMISGRNEINGVLVHESMRITWQARNESPC